jgi:hypothetical protein
MGLDRVFHASKQQACDACAGVDEDGRRSPLAADRAIERGVAVWIDASDDPIGLREAMSVSLGP